MSFLLPVLAAIIAISPASTALLPVFAVTIATSASDSPPPCASSTWSTPPYPSGEVLHVTSVAPGIVRVTTVPRGAPPGPFSPVSLILPQPQPAPQLCVNASRPTDAVYHLSTADLILTVSKASPLANVTRKADGLLLSAEQRVPVRASGSACGDASAGGPMNGGRWPSCDACCLRSTRSLQPGEEFFGGGVQMYKWFVW